MTPYSAQLLPRRGSSQDGSPPHCTESSSRTGLGKLGDFSKLQGILTPSKKSGLNTRVSGTHESLEKPRALGDFSKLHHQLAQLASEPPAAPSLPAKIAPVNIPKRAPQPISATSVAKELTKTSSSNTASSESDSHAVSGLSSGYDSDLEPDSAESTPASSPSSSLGKESSDLDKYAKTKAKTCSSKPTCHSSTVAARRSPPVLTQPQNQLQLVLSYQHYKYGPMIPMYDKVRTKDEKHESLEYRLIGERLIDNRFDNENGIHVFIDMSNIIISFHKALRVRYRLQESVRFVPLPAMDIHFFHQLLVRGRGTKVLNLGCSMRPDRTEPSYVNEFRRLDYRVDLRYRQLENTHNPKKTHSTFSHPRYVEDMVDETLQTRIGESVMQYFEDKGTLVLATGDARPAKFSDGFFTYADRALKMGWNVEVVSWKSSLSGAWTNRAWTNQWNDRFRVIYLDDYLDELLECPIDY